MGWVLKIENHIYVEQKRADYLKDSSIIFSILIHAEYMYYGWMENRLICGVCYMVNIIYNDDVVSERIELIIKIISFYLLHFNLPSSNDFSKMEWVMEWKRHCAKGTGIIHLCVHKIFIYSKKRKICPKKILHSTQLLYIILLCTFLVIPHQILWTIFNISYSSSLMLHKTTKILYKIQITLIIIILKWFWNLIQKKFYFVAYKFITLILWVYLYIWHGIASFLIKLKIIWSKVILLKVNNFNNVIRGNEETKKNKKVADRQENKIIGAIFYVRKIYVVYITVYNFELWSFSTSHGIGLKWNCLWKLFLTTLNSVVWGI